MNGRITDALKRFAAQPSLDDDRQAIVEEIVRISAERKSA
jgi:hypothetical protein